MDKAIKAFLGAALAVAAVAWWFKDEPPAPEKLDLAAIDEPLQKRVHKPAFDISAGGETYSVQPRYSYELNGIIVSMHDSDTWWDYAHKEWGDHVNVVDLCVAWGDTVRSGAYRDASYSNTQWECWWSYSSERARQNFRNDEVSNNHLVTADPALAKALRGLHIGDQVSLKGYLVDYTYFRDGQPAGTRVSSESRTDSGPHACEVLYLEDLVRVRSANRSWRIAWWSALGALALGVVAWFAWPARVND